MNIIIPDFISKEDVILFLLNENNSQINLFYDKKGNSYKFGPESIIKTFTNGLKEIHQYEINKENDTFLLLTDSNVFSNEKIYRISFEIHKSSGLLENLQEKLLIILHSTKSDQIKLISKMHPIFQ